MGLCLRHIHVLHVPCCLQLAPRPLHPLLLSMRPLLLLLLLLLPAPRRYVARRRLSLILQTVREVVLAQRAASY